MSSFKKKGTKKASKKQVRNSGRVRALQPVKLVKNPLMDVLQEKLKTQMTEFKGTLASVSERINDVKAYLEERRAKLDPLSPEFTELTSCIVKLHNSLELLKAEGKPELTPEDATPKGAPFDEPVRTGASGGTGFPNPNSPSDLAKAGEPVGNTD